MEGTFVGIFWGAVCNSVTATVVGVLFATCAPSVGADNNTATGQTSTASAGQQSSPAAALCTAKTGTGALEAVDGAANAEATASAALTTGFIAAGSDVQIIIDRPYDANEKLTYGAVLKPDDSNQANRGQGVGDAAARPASAAASALPSLLAGPAIAVRQIDPNDPRVTEHRVSQTATVATLLVPAVPGSLWDYSTLYFWACKNGAPAFLTTLRAQTSWRGFCIPIVIVLVAVIYLLTVTAVYFVDRTHKRLALSWWRYLDPVDLTAGVDGKGSLWKLQILFFSLIVFGLLSYIVMRTGVLSDLSQTILILLGISGVGAAAAKGTDVSRQRLSFENWAWLIRKGWLPEGGVATDTQARWRDLISNDGEFDVYRFQMLIFSLVVGAALLATGLNDLASFKIPETLLGILGLSQVVYIGGKLVSPPSFAELNTALTNIQELERRFIKVAATTPTPGSAAGTPVPPPATLAEAQQRVKSAASEGDRDVFIKYDEAVRNARVMFKSLFGREVTDTMLEPSIA